MNLSQLSNPEYLHVLLNPVPVYGLAVGLLSLLGALIAKSRAARVTALALIFVCALSAWPVYEYGEASYDRVLAVTDPDGAKWLEEHEERAEQLIFIYYVVAALAAASMAAERFLPRAAVPLAVVTVCLAVGGIAAGGHVAQAGGRIRHREFRYEPPPAKSSEHEQ